MPRSTPARLVPQPSRTDRPKARKTPRPTAPRQRRQSAQEQLIGFPLQRVFQVLTWINDGKLVTKKSLAAEWDISRSTVKRDLAFMRTRLEMPLEWDDVRKTFYFSRPYQTLPFLILTRQEALAIALAERVCGGLFGPTFGRLLDGILKKIAPVLGSAVSRAVASMQHVHAPQPASAADEFELLLPLLDVIEGRRVLQFDYTKRGAVTSERRVVHPLEIGLVANFLRLIAYDPQRGDVRDFVFTRIRHLKPRDEIFKRPKDFDARKRVEDSAGAHAGGKVQEVRIALDPLAAASARERVWHHSQKLKPLPDGRTEATLRVSDLPGIRNRVLSWGRHAEVIAPAELRDEVREELRTALAHYSAP